MIHLGDAEETAKNFDMFPGLKNEDIDIAFIPYWYVWSQEGREVMKKHIQAERIFLIHITPGNLNDEVKQIQRHLREFPDILILHESMENHRVGKMGPSEIKSKKGKKP